jgi:hypothetical protein
MSGTNLIPSSHGTEFTVRPFLFFGKVYHIGESFKDVQGDRPNIVLVPIAMLWQICSLLPNTILRNVAFLSTGLACLLGAVHLLMVRLCALLGKMAKTLAPIALALWALVAAVVVNLVTDLASDSIFERKMSFPSAKLADLSIIVHGYCMISLVAAEASNRSVACRVPIHLPYLARSRSRIGQFSTNKVFGLPRMISANLPRVRGHWRLSSPPTTGVSITIRVIRV